jgi:fatty-acid desaturase
MLSGQGSPLSYAAIHRTYHHPNADRNEKDPHSPHIGSFWHSYYGWHFKMFNFNMHSIRDLTRSKFLLWCHHNYYAFFLLSHLIIGLISFKVLIFCVVLPSLLHVHEMNVLNSLSHMRWFGYRNFDCDDESVNNVVFGWLSWGTGFHNNHHARPAEWHNQVRWYEFDPFRWIVPLIKKSS